MGSENNGHICRVKTLQESHGSEPYSRSPAGAALWKLDSGEVRDIAVGDAQGSYSKSPNEIRECLDQGSSSGDRQK